MNLSFFIAFFMKSQLTPTLSNAFSRSRKTFGVRGDEQDEQENKMNKETSVSQQAVNVALIVPDTTITFQARGSKLDVYNIGYSTIAFAVAASSPGLISISPLEGFLPPGKRVSVVLRRLTGNAAGEDAVLKLPHFVVVRTALSHPSMLGLSLMQGLTSREHTFEHRLVCVVPPHGNADGEFEASLVDAACTGGRTASLSVELKELRQRCSALEKLAVLRSVQLDEAEARVASLQVSANVVNIDAPLPVPVRRPAVVCQAATSRCHPLWISACLLMFLVSLSLGVALLLKSPKCKAGREVDRLLGHSWSADRVSSRRWPKFLRLEL